MSLAGVIRCAFSAITAGMEAAIESSAYRLVRRAKCRVISALAALCVAVCVLGIVLSRVAGLEGQRRVPIPALQTTFDSRGTKNRSNCSEIMRWALEIPCRELGKYSFYGLLETLGAIFQ